MSNVKANTEKPKRDKYTWLGCGKKGTKIYFHNYFSQKYRYKNIYIENISALLV